jgi:hypothetical protein
MSKSARLAWYDRPMAADANGFPLVRAELDLLVATYCPPLLLEDAIGLIVFGLSMRLVRYLPPKNVPLPRVFRARCEGAALEIVANSHLAMMHRAGIIPVLAHPCRLERPLTEWWEKWRPGVLSPLATAPADLGDRLDKIREIASSIMKEALSEDLLRGVRVGTYASRKEHGKPKRDPDDTPVSFAATFWAIEPSDDKEDRCYVVGDDRKIHISARYVRDKQGRPHQVKRVGKAPIPPPTDHFDAHNLGSSGVHFPKERPLSALQTEDDIEALDALAVLEGLSVADDAFAAAASAEVGAELQAVVAEFLAEDPDPVDRLLLEHAPSLIDGGTNRAVLARKSGHPERTLNHAWQRIVARMATHPRMRGRGRIA